MTHPISEGINVDGTTFDTLDEQSRGYRKALHYIAPSWLYRETPKCDYCDNHINIIVISVQTS